MHSKIIGYFLFIITILLYIYYTLWVYLKPFLNKNNFLNKFFLINIGLLLFHVMELVLFIQ